MSELSLYPPGTGRVPRLRSLVLFSAAGAAALVFCFYWFAGRTKHESEAAVATAESAAAAGTNANTMASGSAPVSAPAANVAAADLVAQARVADAQGKFMEARSLYWQALEGASDPGLRSGVEEALGALNVKLVIEPHRIPEKVDHVVREGESVKRLASRFGTTVQLVVTNNFLVRPDLVKAGDLLRVFNGKFKVEVAKSRNELRLTMNDRFFKRYTVSTGSYGRTPAGTYEIRDKTVDPVWPRPDGKLVPFGDPENILGTRWMTLRPTGDTPPVRGYGIHGTWEEASIGRQVSAGCVRMLNRDVEELYLLLPEGTPVTVVE